MANVQTKEKSEVAAFDLNLILEDAGTAGENMTSDDMLIPRLRILQSQSPQVNKADGAYIKGAEAGHIFENVSNTVTDGEKGLTIVPVSFRKTYIEWTKERKLVGDHGLQPAHIDKFERDEKGTLVNKTDGNTLSLTAEYFIYVVDEDGNFTPAILSMSNSGLKKSGRWNSMMNRLQIPHPSGKGTINPAMFWTAYKLTSVPEQNEFGSWFNWEIEMKFDAKSGGILKNLEKGEQIYLEAREFKKRVQNKEVKVSPESSDDDVM
jgi:hypothetical protein